MNVDVVIIGGGPAGLFAGIQTGRKLKTIILEKKPDPGKKLLMTGSGQCNLTQNGEIKKLLNHYGDHGRYIRNALYKFSNTELINFFRKKGVDFVTTEKGKVFPSTYKASDILDVLLKECKNNSTKINCNEAVTDISLKENKEFHISSTKKKYRAKFLVLATGGQSYPTTGSTGDGYYFAKSLGHRIKKPTPALTPIYVKKYLFKDIAGISQSNIKISLWRNDKLLKRWSGDLLFTHRGLSGPGILNYSRFIQKDDTIKLRLIDVKNEAILVKDLNKKINKNGKFLFKTILRNYPIPQRLADKLLNIAGISEMKKAAHINKNERNKIIKLLFALPFTVDKLGGFNEAMVTSGGINLKEINLKTMESRIVSNLFAVGEVLDLDGDTGGYNLQAAFSTAFLAADTIVNKTNNKIVN